MKKKTCFVIIIFFFCLLFHGAGAANPTSGSCGENCRWKYENGVLTITGTGAISDYSYSEFTGPGPSFAPWRYSPLIFDIQEIIVGEGITRIGEGAFCHLSGCTSVSLPSTLTEVGTAAFQNSNALKSVSFADGITELAFKGNAFYACSGLEAFAFPSCVTDIPASMFTYCSKLRDVTIPEGVTSIGQYAFARCGSLRTISLPESLNSAGMGAFSGSGLEEITIPEGLTYISRSFFEECGSLAEVRLQEGLQTIDENAFKGCLALSEITIPASVTTLYSSAFTNTPSSLKIYVYCNTPSARMHIYHSVIIHTDIRNDPAADPTCTDSGRTEGSHCGNCNEVITPQGEIDALGHDTVIIPGHAATMKKPGFTDGLFCVRCRSMVSAQQMVEPYGEMEEPDLRLPEDLAAVEDEAFAGIDAQVVLLPEGVTSIGNRAFSGNASLWMINIPDSVTTIGEDVFLNCSENLLIYGSEESAAQSLAESNHCIFVLMD